MHGTGLRLSVYAALIAGLVLSAVCVDTSHAQELRQEYVRLTYYLQRGVMADGVYVHRGAAACSQWLPFGTQLRLPDGYTVTCEDRGLGDLFWRAWTDIWVPDRASGQSLTRAYGDYVWADLLRLGWDE
jgi:hypothetical protein